MDLKNLAKKSEHILRSNSPGILTGLGVGGVVSTGYLAYRTGFQAGSEFEKDNIVRMGDSHYAISRKEFLKLHWKRYIPPVISGTLTIACIVGATRIGNRRTAALAAAYSLSERALVEYKDEVIKQIGVRKEQKVRDDIAQDKVTKAALPGNTLVLGSGPVMCFELHTGRPFMSDMETLKKAQNEINARLLRHDYASLQNFYEEVGLGRTSSGSDFGWTSDRQMELEFSTTMANEATPCIAFEYNYLKAL